MPPGLASSAGGLLEDSKRDLFAIDMHRGELLQLVRDKEAVWAPKFRGLRNPCHFESTDLDGDGKRDAVIADLGSYTPEDHAFGRVLWLHDQGGGRMAVEELMTGEQSADAPPADFNGDGKLDLVVAEFGWQKTGGVWLLLQGLPLKSGGLQFWRGRRF